VTKCVSGYLCALVLVIVTTPVADARDRISAQSARSYGCGVSPMRLMALDVPSVARAQGACGEVKVQFDIDESGRAENIRAISGHTLLRRAAADAIAGAQFVPCSRNGLAVVLTGATHSFFVRCE